MSLPATTLPLPADPASDEGREPVLSPIDRVCELCFGLFMALTFVGAVSVAAPGGEDPGRVMFYTALGCNLAWGLADGVMYLVRTLTQRARRLSLALAIRADKDPARGVALLRAELTGVLRTLVSDAELEAIRARVAALPDVPAKARFIASDFAAAATIFVLVTVATFPVALPFLVMEMPGAMLASRILTLVMLFGCGMALGRFAGGGAWKAGFALTVVGCILTAAIIALGG